MEGMKYSDYVDYNYEPNKDELIALFYIEPREGLSWEDSAGRVASESSNGTWAELSVDSRIKNMRARAFEIDTSNNLIKIAYPPELFEAGNMPQILSGIAGNIMGMKAVDKIRLKDCKWPKSLIKEFKGPQFGTSVRNKIFNADDRPITATVPKPKVGLTTEQHAKIGYEAWTGGVDLLKDDENLTNQNFNQFEDRVIKSLEMRDKAEEETGEKKSYLINITADSNEMIKRAEFVKEHGGEYVMVDIITAGWAGLQAVREKTEDLGLAIHAHRAMHAAFDRITTHGVSMRCIAQFARIVGVDQLHTGTANLGKLENEDTVGINDWMYSELYGLNDVLPMASGGLHPGIVPKLIERTGKNIGIQIGGGIHGHPDGTHAGAKALRQALNSVMEDIDIHEYAKDHQELKKALEKWGHETPI